ncbi:hypothetical protein [Virgisporangium aurantiacum]|uniref:Uncharacterized protein n=1 Tax=Virgisporangium aurantiacum TaxID=175570 RepID=A0A8J3ZND2_9ACTN|nr:hypothetical protein [Virgisporangium aurantiacum]GIJ64701.1 hypothetical protein Vau01_122170 [Virgisporangium aurantiacum]
MGIDIPSADWQSMPMQDAVDEFGFADDIECFFLDEPTNDALLHRGDLVVPGPLAVDGDEIQLHAIDGRLTVKDAFSFQNVDVYAALCATGSVTAQSMTCIWDVQFVIAGSVNVERHPGHPADRCGRVHRPGRSDGGELATDRRPGNTRHRRGLCRRCGTRQKTGRRGRPRGVSPRRGADP